MKVFSLVFFLGCLALFLDTDFRSAQGSPQWYTLLPDCPCRNPDEHGVKVNDGWASDQGDIGFYHPGARQCFRSYPYQSTSAGKSGQQCCYDAQRLLIKTGPGAGTPDKVSTCAGEDKTGTMTLRTAGLWGHYWKDVRPWKQAGQPTNAWKTYNQKWVPNEGKNCQP